MTRIRGRITRVERQSTKLRLVRVEPWTQGVRVSRGGHEECIDEIDALLDKMSDEELRKLAGIPPSPPLPPRFAELLAQRPFDVDSEARTICDEGGGAPQDVVEPTRGVEPEATMNRIREALTWRPIQCIPFVGDEN